MRRKIFAFVFVFCLVTCGCISIPPVCLDEEKGGEELASHIKFLSQSGLKGRQPMTLESGIARQYIESRFKAYGLTPWGKEKGYEQSFGYGTNVVGVLPGSDANLGGEIVLVSAHYDHIGKDAKGRICPGAADNAAGVAALLKTAEQMGLYEKRSRRTVAFAAFDCEEWMLFGAFAFLCRQDVNEAKIAAVVNADLLGRDLLDVVQNTVFVAGTEEYPEIREKIFQSGSEAGIRMLPIGTDWVGPMGDHAAFESRPIPCLFFTSGIYKDYHKSTDTADKLNYSDIEKAARVILETVKELANGEETKQTANAQDGDTEELRTLKTVTTEVGEKYEQAGMKKEDGERCRKLTAEAENLLSNGGYDRRAREKLMAETTGLLGPYWLPIKEIKKAGGDEQQEKLAKAVLQILQQFYVNCRKEIMQGQRRLVAHILKYRPGLFRGMPKFEYGVYEIPDDNIRMTPSGKDRYILNVLAWDMKIEFKPPRWLGDPFNLGINSKPVIDCEGTKEQITDFCLLKLRSQQGNDLVAPKIKKIMRAVTGTEPKGNFKELLQERLKQGGFKDETEWMQSCILSDSAELALAAMLTVNKNKDKDERLRDVLRKVVADRNKRPDVRGAAMVLVNQGKNKNALSVTCDVLDDANTLYKKEYLHIFRKEYPFSENIMVKTVRDLIEKEWEKDPDMSKTIGDLAQRELKKTTKKDFGKDRQQWRKWIETNVK